MSSITMIPRRENFPQQGGVREHLIQLTKCIESSNKFNIVPFGGSLTHVESSYNSKDNIRPDIYVCHGGFEPEPIQAVLRNLRDAKLIVSVARWMVPAYMSAVTYKTVVIPNGIDLDDFKSEYLQRVETKPGYVLYPKAVPYHMDDVFDIAGAMPKTKFLTIARIERNKYPNNIRCIGLQSHRWMKNYIRDAACVLLTGPEVCPKIMLEAWAVGTPVVFHNYDRGAWELTTWGHSHPICVGAIPYRTLPEAVRAVEVCRDNKAYYGEAGKQMVADHFQWNKLFKRYEGAYDALTYGDIAVQDFIKAAQKWYTTRPSPLPD